MLVTAHFYEKLPAQFPACGFREHTGIPCLACGGTRAMQSLAHGKWREAFMFHPLFSALVLASPLWFALGLNQFLRGDVMPSTEIQNRRLKRGAVLFFALLLLNWLYLLFFLP